MTAGPDREAGLLSLFVYGTLKRGQINHDRYCHGAAAVEDAVTLGRLFHLPAGYPALAVLPEVVLAEAGRNLAADLELQQEWLRRLEAEPGNGWGESAGENRPRVSGERMSFSDAERRLPRLDRLEVFRPGRRSLFQRVLIRTWVGDARVLRPAWAYIQSDPSGIPMPAGSWPGWAQT